ncbi:hypothetical protein MGH68_12500 [Erysipelothrix sp. D19-032]
MTQRTDTSAYRYLSGHVAYSGVVPFYDATSERYKITISGIEGWVPKSAFKEFKVSEVKGANYYSVRNGNLYNNISMGATTNNYGIILNGPKTIIPQRRHPLFLTRWSLFL